MKRSSQEKVSYSDEQFQLHWEKFFLDEIRLRIHSDLNNFTASKFNEVAESIDSAISKKEKKEPTIDVKNYRLRENGNIIPSELNIKTTEKTEQWPKDLLFELRNSNQGRAHLQHLIRPWWK